MATLHQLIQKYKRDWNKYGMGSVVSYSEVVSDLERCEREQSANSEPDKLRLAGVSDTVCDFCDKPMTNTKLQTCDEHSINRRL
jgi:hypothetical protein